MPSIAFRQVIERAIVDDAFASLLKTNHHEALAGYDLTDAERTSLAAGGTTTEAATGLDARITKSYGRGSYGRGSYGRGNYYGYGR